MRGQTWTKTCSLSPFSFGREAGPATLWNSDMMPIYMGRFAVKIYNPTIFFPAHLRLLLSITMMIKSFGTSECYPHLVWAQSMHVLQQHVTPGVMQVVRCSLCTRGSLLPESGQQSPASPSPRPQRHTRGGQTLWALCGPLQHLRPPPRHLLQALEVQSGLA